MNGRRLYELFCDSRAEYRHAIRWVPEGTAAPQLPIQPVAWPFLAPRDREVWNALAKRITPKRKTIRAVVLAHASAEKRIQAIKELRSLTKWGLLESQQATDSVIAGEPLKLPIPKGYTAASIAAEMPHWTVVA